MKRMPALSLQQPNAEAVLRGTKDIEYRSMPTNKRERVYIYASKRPAAQVAWDEISSEPGALPTGVIVGLWKLGVVERCVVSMSGTWPGRFD
jgi:hypothetical protein